MTVQLAGLDVDGNPVDSWGTGLVINRHHVIINKHVVNGIASPSCGLAVHPSRNQGDVEILSSTVVAVPYPTIDVAVIKFELPEGKYIPRVPGIGLRDPDWADEMYVFGYPRVPMTAEMAITVQRGEVVNPTAETIPDRQKIFLYSAIARPGNSGGPIVAQDGRAGLTGVSSIGLRNIPAERCFRHACGSTLARLIRRKVSRLTSDRSTCDSRSSSRFQSGRRNRTRTFSVGIDRGLRAPKARQASEQLALGKYWPATDLAGVAEGGRPIPKMFRGHCVAAHVPVIQLHDARHAATTMPLDSGTTVAAKWLEPCPRDHPAGLRTCL